MAQDDKIRITPEDLGKPQVDETLARQREQRAAAQIHAADTGTAKGYGMAGPPLIAPGAAPATGSALVSSAVLYTGLAGGIGALIAWIVTEIVIPDVDNPAATDELILAHSALWLAIIGALAGGALGSVEGIASRAPTKAIRSGAVGFLAGMIGGALGGALGTEVFSALSGGGSNTLSGQQVLARTVGWAIAGAALGLGQGIAMLSARKVTNGLLGGIVGGIIGGLLFNPLTALLGDIGNGLVSRGIGIILLGAAVGVMMGLVDEALKDAWLKVEQGLLAGKQFIIYKDPTFIGSAPKDQIYLFKDPSVQPQHAAIHIAGPYYEIEDMDSGAGTFVNGVSIKRTRLRNGDAIQVGTTVFRYMEKRREGAQA